eukprot:766874-Amphidinium_carterae.1
MRHMSGHRRLYVEVFICNSGSYSRGSTRVHTEPSTCEGDTQKNIMSVRLSSVSNLTTSQCPHWQATCNLSRRSPLPWARRKAPFQCFGLNQVLHSKCSCN